MDLKPSLSITQRQKLAITAQMQQSVAILGMSNAQLLEFLRVEQSENPVLELSDQFGSVPTGSIQVSPDKLISDTVAAQETLISGLIRQLNNSTVTPSEQRAAEVLIGNLNNKGHLDETLELIAKTSGITLSLINRALQIVQGFEPAGVGARNLVECIELQLKGRDLWSEDYALLLNSLTQQPVDFSTLAANLGLPEETVDLMLNVIRNTPFDMSDIVNSPYSEVAVPDILFSTNKDGEVSVVLNEYAFPRIRADSAYFDGSLGSSELVKSYFENHYRRIHWLERALEKRASTILRIAIAIGEIQYEFLHHGPIALKPLTMKQVAESVKVHESTVSRAVSGKSFHCDVGTFPMRFLFSNTLIGGSYGPISATVIRTKIRNFVENETAANVLSDANITDLLAQEGITVARRTVAKYRGCMNVPTSSIRRIQKRNKQWS